MRYYLGVDWADQTHAVWVVDERGTKITARTVPHTAEGLSEWGRELDEWRAQGIELWAAIERPDGRVVDFLLDHGVVVYPVNPKALDRARDRFRQSGAKSDPFDARVLADFLRTDHAHLRALQPSSEAAQELKLLTEDCQRQVRQQTRLVNQLTATLKAYYPRALEVAELTTALAREFLQAYPTPAAVAGLTERQWQRWARAHRLSEARTRRALGRPPAAAAASAGPRGAGQGAVDADLGGAARRRSWRPSRSTGRRSRIFREPCRRRSGRGRSRSVTTGSPRPRSGPAWGRPGRWESFQHLQAHGRHRARDRSGAASSSGSSTSASPATRRCGTWSIRWRSSRCARVSGPGRTTTSSGRGATRITRRSGRWARSG